MSDADGAGGDGDDDDSAMLRLTLSCCFFCSLLLVPMMVSISSVDAVAAAGAAEANRMSGAHGTIRHTATDSGTRRALALAPTRQRRRLVRVVEAPMVELAITAVRVHAM
mmetsp:Transcript_31882/g.70653  ORF Transcript_31882/g.70653 Transcript_31882/m.70653 type:complete len:110 (-) Transcript_31882:21-350(-)